MTKGPGITRTTRTGSCLVATRAALSECVDCAETARPILTAQRPLTRLLAPWELLAARCTCPWCRWEALAAAQRRAREPRILAVSHESPPTPLPPWIMAAFERPSLREMAHAAQRVIPRLMGPAWWLRPSAPRQLPTDGSTP